MRHTFLEFTTVSLCTHISVEFKSETASVNEIGVILSHFLRLFASTTVEKPKQGK